MKFIRAVIGQSLLTNLLSVFIVIAGLLLVLQMKREAFPDFSFDVVTIRTVFPGASPEEVEKLITIPIEDELNGVSELKEVDSTSLEGASFMVITIDPDARNKDKVVTNIQRAVDRVDDLPVDAEDPVVKEIITGESPIIEVSVGGDMTEFEMQQHAKILEDRILDIRGVSTIARTNWRERQIWIEANPKKLAQYYMSMEEVVDAVRNHSVNIAGGTIRGSTKELLVRTVGEIEQPEPYNDLVIRSDPDGNQVRIRDIGQAKNAFLEQDTARRVRGEPAILLRVIKKSTGDTIDIVEDVFKVIDQYREEGPNELIITTINDQSFYISRRLKILLNNGWLGILLVVTILLIFLNWRIALVTALGIPIAFFLTFSAMSGFGISINLISMFGLIIVLGMIVDDAIIIAENSYRYIELGYEPKEAAIVGTAEVIKPVTVTILTTIASFMPLMFMTGIFGKFVWQIPAVVILALASSLLEGVFVLPAHVVDFAKTKPKEKRRRKSKIFHPILKAYTAILVKCLRRRYVVLFGTLLILTGTTIFAFKSMKFVLFPSEGIEIFFVRAELERDTPLITTEKLMAPLEDAIENLHDGELDNYITISGIHQNDGEDPLTRRGSNLGQITVYLTPPQNRKRDANEIIADLEDQFDDLKGFKKITFDRVNPGPPVGKPVAIRIKGDHFDEMEAVAEVFKKELETIDGVFSIDDDYEPGKSELQVLVDENKAKRASLNILSIGSAVRRVFNGETARRIRTTEDELDIVVRYPKEWREDEKALDQLSIRNPAGRLVPFKNVASTKVVPGVNAIKHRDGKRVITVFAEIKQDVTSAVEVNRQVSRLLPEIYKQHPRLVIDLGGEVEDTQESLTSLRNAFILAALLIFIILTTLFRSLFRPLIVMAAIPLGMIGVIFGFATHNMPLSFMALLGSIGLAGVVVNDSIVLVDFIRNLRLKGLSNGYALVRGGQKRLRPVILTTLTTVMGLMPVAYGIGGNDPFLKPAALAVCWGLVFGTSIILIVVPCLQAFQDDVAHVVKDALGKGWD